MEIYDCKVRLNGSAGHEVPKRVSAPEVLVLRRIHGGDAVVGLKKVAAGKLTSEDKAKFVPSKERERLRHFYQQVNEKTGIHVVDEIFGGEHVPLPQTLEVAPVAETVGDLLQ